MRSGRRAAGIAGGVLSLGGCVAATSTVPASATPAREASTTPAPPVSSSSSNDAATGRRVRVEVSAAGVAVDGGRASSDQAALKAALLTTDHDFDHLDGVFLKVIYIDQKLTPADA